MLPSNKQLSNVLLEAVLCCPLTDKITKAANVSHIQMRWFLDVACCLFGEFLLSLKNSTVSRPEHASYFASDHIKTRTTRAPQVSGFLRRPLAGRLAVAQHIEPWLWFVGNDRISGLTLRWKRRIWRITEPSPLSLQHAQRKRDTCWRWAGVDGTISP